MVDTTIDQNFEESQVYSKVTCILCDGSHGNNALCQITGGDLYVF